jgi:hypothetical protein
VDLYAKVRLHLKSLTVDTASTVTFGNETGGGWCYFKTIDGEFSIPSTSPQITVNNTTDTIIEAWTYNGGTDVYLKLVGVFE